MTVVLGLRCADGAVLGADSGGFNGWNVTARRDPKVFTLRQDFAVGFTTSYRFGQIIRYHVAAPTSSTADKYDLLVSKWVPVVRKALKAHGYTKIEHNVEEAGTMIVAWGDRLFFVHDDFQVGEPVKEIYSVGAGFMYALGAIAVIAGEVAPIEESVPLVERALKTTAEFCAAVRGPFTVVTTKA